MPGDVFKKIGDSMGRAVTKISVKTSSSLEKSKIKMHIDSLSKDVQKMLTEIGEGVYSLWLNGEGVNQDLLEKMKVVKQKKDEIEKLIAELNSIDDRDNEILGTTIANTQSDVIEASNNPCCSNCGTEHDPVAKFCRKCGNKL